jgi:hypothetical protein
MFLRTNCPYCKEKIQKGAVLCKHCQTSLEWNGNATIQQTDVGIRHLQNAFAKINSECETIEKKMKLQTGFVFIKHLYSSDELLYALSKIETFVEGMWDDLDEWESMSKSGQQIRSLFNQKADETFHRLESLHSLIEQREPKKKKKVKSIFKRIIDKLLSIFPLEMIAGKAIENVLAVA